MQMHQPIFNPGADSLRPAGKSSPPASVDTTARVPLPRAKGARSLLAGLLGGLLAVGLTAGELPILTSGHTDVGVNYEDDAWDLHVHAESLGEEYEPDAVWLKVGAAARTSVPANEAFKFLGEGGSPVWILPAIQKPGLLFLGLGTEEMAAGLFTNDTVRLALKSVEGPGHFAVYQLDAFGAPVVFMNSRDGIDANDTRSLAAGGHTHVNWAFSAPGKYRIGLQATGVLATSGQSTTSEVGEYLFDVGEAPRLTLAKEAGHDHLHLEWLSETNARYQIQYRTEVDSGNWTNLGSPIPGTGGVLEEHIEPESTRQFYRLLVDYGPSPEPGILARLFVADATNSVLSLIDLETGAVSPGLFPLASRAVLGSSPSSRYCLAVELDADKAELFDSGIYVEDHGDHWHYYKENPRRLSVSLLGDNPVHTVTVGDWLTLHWDLSGRVDLFRETELAALGDAYAPATLAAGKQHGSAVPLTVAGRFFAVSKPNPLYPVPVPNPLPVGVDIWDLDTSNRVHTVSGYSNMHGEAGNGWSAAFGFTEGVLVLWQGAFGWTNFMVTNAASMPAGYRIGDLRGHESLNHYFGLAFQSETAGDMFVIDATNLTMAQLPLPGGSFAVAYELSPEGDTFNVVLANGDFVQIDARTLQVLGTRTGLIAPSTNHGNHGQFHPGVAVGLGRICVTDPVGQRVLELDAASLQTLRTFSLPGTPTKVSMHGVLVPPTREPAPRLYTLGHADIRPLYKAGNLQLVYNLEPEALVDGQPAGTEAQKETGVEFAPASLRTVLPDAPLERPEGSEWDFLGTSAGQPVWFIPEVQEQDRPWLGLSTESLTASDWVEGVVQIQLVSFAGPPGGHFALYQNDGLVNDVHFQTVDGVDNKDVYRTHGLMGPGFPAHIHAHANWSFTKPGLYQIRLRFSGTHVTDGPKAADAVFIVQVGEA